MFGRDKEKRLFDKLVSINEPHFVAIYGRRRVGKTFLIREHFKNKFCFTHTGAADMDMGIQLANFNRSIQDFGLATQEPPADWFEAFEALKTVITKSSRAKKIVFIDELPWMDTPRSKFLAALEHFWNSWGSTQPNLIFIVCGSATSYIVNKIFANTGGLHNRVTQKIKLEPFNLHETQQYLNSRGIAWNQYQIVQAYMATGGIPFYLKAMEKGKSPEQMIDALFFAQDGLLRNEFHHLYASLFRNEAKYIDVIRALSTKSKGLTRSEIEKKVETSNGGSLTRILDELELSDFIKKYTPFGKKMRNSLYQLTDYFSLFYFRFIDAKTIAAGDWIAAMDQPHVRAWSGYAFEQVCLAHIPQIKKALGIAGVHTKQSGWVSNQKENRAQVDLVLERRDNIVHLFEMKFSVAEYTITQKYDQELRQKMGRFKEETKTKSAVWLAMLTTFGLTPNSYAHNIQNALTMECLFEGE